MGGVTAARSIGRVALRIAQLIGAVVFVILFGGGIPLFWVWLGSQLQGGTAPSLGGLGVALIGISGSYVALAVVLATIKERRRQSSRPVRYEWNRSLSAERYQPGRNTTALDDIVIAATMIVGLICTVWFLLFGDPGVPVT